MGRRVTRKRELVLSETVTEEWPDDEDNEAAPRVGVAEKPKQSTAITPPATLDVINTKNPLLNLRQLLARRRYGDDWP
jgi:hypothetical protein